MGIVKFKDIVYRANTKEDRFNTEKIYYVGGEHIDSSNVLITKKGLIEGSTIGPMFYFGFKAGQVLFVTRNPHLRKAGVVTFDGICSEKTFVLETKDENVLLQRYLPFVMQSNHFWNYMEAHKSGSVNFFINWSTLAEYEFDLPSLERQQEIADLLWSINDTKVAYEKMIEATDELVKSQFIEMFGDPYSNTKELPVFRVGDLCDVTKLAGYEYTEYIHYQDSGDVVMVKGLNVKEKHLKLDDISYINADVSDSLPRSQLHEGDVVMTYIGINLGDVAIVDGNHRYHLAPNVAKISVKDKSSLLPEFLVNQIYYSRDKFTRNAGNTAKAVLNMDKIRKIEIILPEVKAQREFIAFVEQSDKSKFELQKAIENLKQMQRTIIEENV